MNLIVARVNNGDIEIGSLIAFLNYLMQILFAVMMATFMAVMVPRASVSADRITEVLHTNSSVVPPSTPISPTTRTGEVSLDAVQFSYPGASEPVLRDISLQARPGTTTAIIGSTGAGKTTLVQGLVAAPGGLGRGGLLRHGVRPAASRATCFEIFLA